MIQRNYAISQRLHLIEVLVQLYGSVSPAVIMAVYGLGHATATRDFKRYQEECPANLAYDYQRKTYVKGPEFNPAYGEML